MAPYVGALWTPPYWGYSGNRYRWYHGYWGSHIGFYGGVNYGFGYVGRGYEGGYWNRGGQFTYNRSVNNVNTTIIHNVYNYRVTNITNVRVSYDGGRGGLNVHPTVREVAVIHEQRIAPVAAQVAHVRQAESNRAQFVSVNNGRPQMLVAAAPLATAYRAPAPHPMAVPGARVLAPVAVRPMPAPGPQPRPVQPQPNAARPMERPAPNARPAERPAPNVRPEARPNPTPMERAPAPNRPAEQPRPAVRPAPEPKPAVRAAPEPRVEQRPAAEPKVAPRAEPKSAPRPAERPAAKEPAKKDTEHEREHPQ